MTTAAMKIVALTATATTTVRLEDVVPEGTPGYSNVYVQAMQCARPRGIGMWLRIPENDFLPREVSDYLCFRAGLLPVHTSARRRDGSISIHISPPEGSNKLAGELLCADAPAGQARGYLNVELAHVVGNEPAGVVTMWAVAGVTRRTLHEGATRNSLFYQAGRLCAPLWKRSEEETGFLFRPQRIWLDGWSRKVVELYNREAIHGA